jgi:hypothetical protein
MAAWLACAAGTIDTVTAIAAIDVAPLEGHAGKPLGLRDLGSAGFDDLGPADPGSG